MNDDTEQAFTVTDLADLLAYLDGQQPALSDEWTLTRGWLTARGFDAAGVIDWLREHGALCGEREVLLNVAAMDVRHMNRMAAHA
jgi:hypothetical protein